MRIKAVLLALTFAVSGAHAAEKACTDTVYGKVATGYVYQDLAFVASDQLVAQGGFSRTCGVLTYDFWTSTELAGGRYGDRGYGDEIDFGAFYNKTVDTFVGPLAVELYGAYYVLPAFARVKDDAVAGWVDVGRPFQVGGVTLMPFLRVFVFAGTNLSVFPAEVFYRPGLRFVVPITATLALSGDVSSSLDVTTDLDTDRAELVLTKVVNDRLRLNTGVKFTERTGPVWTLIGFAWNP